MALALLLKQREAKNSKPGKGENFGCKFKANFVLESSSVKPFGKLTGQLVIESPAPISHYGIRVQFEAICTLKFETKLDNRVRCHCKCGNLLEGGSDKNMVDGYLESPVMIDLEPMIKADSNEGRPYELQAGTNTWGFNISIPGEVLPAPFKNSYGTLVYKLAAYMRSENDVIVSIGEKALKFGGYYNLSKNMVAAKPASIEKSVKRSMFTGKKLVVVTMSLDTCGYLPDDTLRFNMRVQNPKCLPYKMSAQLLQKVIYSVSGTKKSTVAIVGNAEKDVSEPESETVWDGSFKIHKGASPTFVGKSSMYVVSHTLQFKVKLDDHNAMKADQVVYVGTTRETVEALIASINNMNIANNGNNGASERSGSFTSVQSNSSAANSNATVSKSPGYSQLASSASLETFPPGNDDASTSSLKRPIPEDPEDEDKVDADAVLLTPPDEVNENI